MVVLGLMSGTSLDGVDLALMDFYGDAYEYTLLKTVTIPYPKDWRNRLDNARNLNGLELTELNTEYGKYLGDLINQFLKGEHTPELISSHGHTIFHQPQKGFTLQIGALNEIAVATGIKTVGDFRTLDVSKGGQGAPLVPIGDQVLYGAYDYCVNLGGISNYSYSENNEYRAKDISPCNIVANQLMHELGAEYDEDGATGARGNVDLKLLEELNNWTYYLEGKSLGIEDLEKDFLPIIKSSRVSIEDKLRTYYEHLGMMIGAALNKNGSKALITGGGAKNSFLISCIKKYSKSEIVIPDEETIDFKEAIIFGLLGLLRVNNKTNILKSVTGATSDSCSGVIVEA